MSIEGELRKIDIDLAATAVERIIDHYSQHSGLLLDMWKSPLPGEMNIKFPGLANIAIHGESYIKQRAESYDLMSLSLNGIEQAHVSAGLIIGTLALQEYVKLSKTKTRN